MSRIAVQTMLSCGHITTEVSGDHDVAACQRAQRDAAPCAWCEQTECVCSDGEPYIGHYGEFSHERFGTE